MEVSANLVRRPGLDANESYGLLLQDVPGSSLVTGNSVSSCFGGGAAVHTTGLVLRGNAWSLNRQVGVYLAQNQGAVQLTGEVLDRNGGVHLRIYNSRSKTTVSGCHFAGARAGESWRARGFAKSAGMGLELAGKGLVRWAFAQADYPCSPTSTKQVKPLPGGWTRRPVRLPYGMDPCRSWDWEKLQTPEQRLQAGECQRCRDRGQICRWIWKDVGTGQNRAQGLWAPDRVVCANAGEPGSCDDSGSFGPVALKPVWEETFLRGQCVTLPKETRDPCQALTHCATLKRGAPYCIRRQRDRSGPLDAACVAWSNTNASCRPRCQGDICGDPCEGKGVCVAALRVSWPMEVRPPGAELRDNVFWGNPGPDLLMDMAGKVAISGNTFVGCVQGAGSTGCKARVGFRRASNLTWIGAPLPAGATIVWQHPSSLPQPELESRLSGAEWVELFPTRRPDTILLEVGRTQSYQQNCSCRGLAATRLSAARTVRITQVGPSAGSGKPNGKT